MRAFLLFFDYLCGTGDLNPQVFQHMYLKHARLPIPPVPQLVFLRPAINFTFKAGLLASVL